MTIPLTVKDLTISPDGYFVFVKTNNLATGIDFSKATIQINFKGGVLISKDGVIYQSTTDAFSLSDPKEDENYTKINALREARYINIRIQYWQFQDFSFQCFKDCHIRRASV